MTDNNADSLKRTEAALEALKLAQLQRVCFHYWNEAGTECIHCKLKTNF